MSKDLDPVPPELQDGDIVVEVGAYEGAWVAKLCAQGSYDVYAFEPATRAYRMAQEKLGGNPSVTLYDEALGGQDGEATLYDCLRDGANTLVPLKSEPSEAVSVIDAAPFVESVGDVALMHLNAEGGELDILERLMDAGLIERVKMIMVQWHPYSEEDSARIEQVIQRLAETHQLENRYAWGFWKRKERQGHG